ncbi:nucleophile aminohydrolase [Cytidiella melzeri]|nr:nucleophile aminohydrolase [Cytidiella melzeri]
MQVESQFKLIAVHGGAGYHEKSSQSEVEIKRCLKRACNRALAGLNNGVAALEAVEQAIQTLEDDPCLNAGYGSNLTIEGTVECDAAIMDGRTADIGSVGAVSGVKNPIQAAAAVLRHTRQPDALSRIRPILLASGGARSFAEKHHVPCIAPEDLIAPRCKDDWAKWKKRYEEASTEHSESASASDNIEHGLFDKLDTVGAIAWDASRGLAAGVSSGGLLLKSPGRIGEAAMFGAGCWAQQSNNSDVERGVACSFVAGSGEYIMRMMLAKTIGEAVMQAPDDYIDDTVVFHQMFSAMCRARGEREPSVGVLLVTQELNEGGGSIARLWCAFTTKSMAIAYASTASPKPKVPCI